MKTRTKVSSLVLLSISLISLVVTRASAQLSPSAIAAGGDTCASPTLISSLPFNDSGDTTGAADDIRLTGCSGFLSMPGPDLIYAFNVVSGNNLTFTLTPTNQGSPCQPNQCTYDPSIYIRSGCAQTTGACVARSDVGNAGQAETIMVSGLAPGTYYFYVDSIYSVDEIGGSGAYTLSVTGTFGAPNNTSFYTLTPCRIIDTRDAALGGPDPLASGTTRVFTIAGHCGVPPTAKSVSVNITVTQPTSAGHLILFPGGTPPGVSNINFRAGQTRANNAIVPLSASGTLSVADGQSSGTTHFILDVNGYFQ
jgi:hypothetical protein